MRSRIESQGSSVWSKTSCCFRMSSTSRKAGLAASAEAGGKLHRRGILGLSTCVVWTLYPKNGLQPVTSAHRSRVGVWASTVQPQSESFINWPKGGRSPRVLFGQEATALPSVELPWLSFGATQPEPVRVPRKQLNTSFAVMLMRSAYEAADELDFIPMDQFQVQFWKFRQSEFEPYKLMVAPLEVPVGKIDNPIYFDFISFCQWSTFSKAIPDAPQVFQEFCEDCEGESVERPYRTVRRDPALADNSKLPLRLQVHTGKKILSKLQQEFQGEVFNPPPVFSALAGPEQLVSSAQQLLDVFTRNGYCLRATASRAEVGQRGEVKWRTRVEAPANLWGLQMLQFRRALVSNAFDTFTMQAYLEASGYSSKVQMDVQDTFVDQNWTATPLPEVV